ncbi:ABC transporter permease subunit [Acidobacteriota bacterium]
MPIYDQSYRHWEGTLKSRTFRWWVIASRGIRNATKKRIFMFLLFLALIMFVLSAAYIIATTGFFGTIATKYGLSIPDRLILELEDYPRFFEFFLGRQTIFIVILTLYAGASLIANDMRGNALVFYLARPITRLDYIAGKLAVIILIMFTVSLAPALLLYLLKFAFSPKLEFIKTLYWVFFSIIGYSLFIGFFFGLFMLLFSATNRNPRDAALKFVGAFFVSDILSLLVVKITRVKAFQCLSLKNDLLQVLGRFFGTEPRSDHIPFPLEFIIPLAIMAFCLWAVFRKIEQAEGVG